MNINKSDINIDFEKLGESALCSDSSSELDHQLITSII